MLAVTLAPLANAQVFLSTGFEPSDGYSLAPLAGQQGWTGPAPAVVEHLTFFAGTQAVSLPATGLSGPQLVISPQLISSSSSIVTVEVHFMQSSSGTASDWFPLSTFSANGFLADIFVTSAGNAQVGLASSAVGSVPVSRGTWNDYQMVLNFQTGTVTGYVNSQRIGSGPLANTGSLGAVQFGILGTPGTDTGFWDQISATATVSQFVTHLADGGLGDTWQTDILLANTATSPVVVSLVFHLDGSATLLPIATANLGPVSSIDNFVIPPNVSLLIRTGGSPATPLETGWAEIDSAAPINAQAIFRRHALDGNYYEGAVPVVAAVSSFTLPYDDTAYANPAGSVVANFVTGIALTNPNPTSQALVTCSAFDQNANSFGTNLQFASLAGFQHTSFVLTSTLQALGSNRGILVCNSSLPVGVLDLRFFGNYALSSMPIW